MGCFSQSTRDSQEQVPAVHEFPRCGIGSSLQQKIRFPLQRLSRSNSSVEENSRSGCLSAYVDACSLFRVCSLEPNTSSHVRHHYTLDLPDWREGTRVSPSRLPVFLQLCPGSPEPLLAVIASGLGTPHGSRKQQSHFTSWYTVVHSGVDDACFTPRRARIFHILDLVLARNSLGDSSAYRFCPRQMTTQRSFLGLKSWKVSEFQFHKCQDTL